MKPEPQPHPPVPRLAHGRGRRGHAVIEVALIAPWIFFLFVGTLNLGFCLYALICTENAARVAALYTSSDSTVAADSGGACQAALAELDRLPNVRGVSTCTGLPVFVSATQGTDVEGALTTTVAVSYQTVRLIPSPRLLASQLTITRQVQMRVR